MPDQVNPFANQVTQIQIQAVDNVFLVQAVNIDGKNKSARRVSHTVEELRQTIADLATILYVQAPVAEPAPAATPSGPTGPQSPAGT